MKIKIESSFEMICDMQDISLEEGRRKVADLLVPALDLWAKGKTLEIDVPQEKWDQEVYEVLIDMGEYLRILRYGGVVWKRLEEVGVISPDVKLVVVNETENFGGFAADDLYIVYDLPSSVVNGPASWLTDYAAWTLRPVR